MSKMKTVTVKFNNANTGAATIKRNNSKVMTFKNLNDSVLTAGQIVSGDVCIAKF